MADRMEEKVARGMCNYPDAFDPIVRQKHWEKKRLAARAALEASHHKELVEANRTILAWFESEKAGPDYGSQDRKTHPEGERIWKEWWERQLRLCEESEAQARAVLAKVEGNGHA